MKTNLRLMVALGATAFVFSANAQWVKPIPVTQTGLPPMDGETQSYFYNVEAGQFMGEGNAWGTHWSVGTIGNPIIITEYDDNSYVLKDKNIKFGTWTYMGVELAEGDDGAISTNDVWVDYAVNDANELKSIYEFVESGNGFRLKVSSKNTYGTIADKYPNGFCGFNLNASGEEYTASGGYVGNDQTIMYPLLNMDDENSSKYMVDWVYVTVDDYATYASKIGAYNASVTLSKAIAEAKEAGASTTVAEGIYANTESTEEELTAAASQLVAQTSLYKKIVEAREAGADASAIATAEAVYSNPDSTVDELTAAITPLEEAIEAASKLTIFNGASVSNPADVTSLVKNADLSTGSASGWVCDGATPAYSDSEVEVYNSNFNLYQEITDMKAGVYRLTVQGFYRAGGYDTNAEAYLAGTESLNAKLYAGNDSISFRSIYSDPDRCSDISTAVGYIPNSMATAQTCFSSSEDAYLNELYFSFDGGTLRIGAYKGTLLGSDWTIMDSFTLTYYGSDSDAAGLLLSESIKNIDVDSYVDADAPQAAIDALNSAYADAQAGASSVAEAASKKAAVLAAIEDVKAGVNAYAALREYLSGTADEFNSNYTSDEYIALYDEADYGMIDKTLSTERAIAILAEMKEVAADVITNSYSAGDDITKLIENPGFSNNTIDGWTANTESLGVSYSECEAYMLEFEISQTLKNMQPGVYTIRCQAFVRAGSASSAYSAWQAGTEDIQSYIFGNDNRTKIKSICDNISETELFNDGSWMTDSSVGDGYIPNSMAGARAYFDDETFTDELTGNTGRYWNEVNVFVAPEGDRTLKLGFVGEASYDYYWTLFDNFQLVYKGADAELLAELTQVSLDEAAEILNGDDALNADVKEALTEVYSQTVEAAEAGDGDTMMSLYATLLKSITNANASITTYKTLGSALESAQESFSEDEVLTSKPEDARQAFEEVLASIQEKYDEGQYADDEIAAAVTELNNALAALKSSGVNVGDDVSYFLTNPDFDETGGWDGDGFAYDTSASNAEVYNKAFNVYQKLTGIPNGTYELEVVGFYREGSNEEAVNLWNAGTANDAAWVGVYLNDQFVKLPAQGSGMEGGWTEDTDEGTAYSGTSVTAENGLIYYVPNSMTAAGSYFLGDEYKPVTVQAVVTDGTLKVGVMKTSTKTGDWTILDYFHLKYVSADTTGSGTGEEGVGIQGVEAANNANAAIYDLTGRRVSKTQKGVYVVNGKKVVVK